MAQRDLQDSAYRGIKADFDSQMSLYNIAVEHLGKATPERQKTLQEEVDQAETGTR